MDFRDYQRRFTAHIRDPVGAPRPPGAPVRRMRVYNELLFNNVEGFLLACFPVCRAILGKRRWTRLARAFFHSHASRSPFFRQIPEEFLRFLQDEFEPADDTPDFLPELAHYEWVELALDTSDRDVQSPAHDAAADLLARRPVFNPVLRLLAYRYPVHRLSPRYRPAEPPAAPTFILAYRHPDTLEVAFQEINAMTAGLLNLLMEHPGLSGEEALDRLAAENGQHDATAVRAGGHRILDALRDSGAILGGALT